MAGGSGAPGSVLRDWFQGALAGWAQDREDVEGDPVIGTQFPDTECLRLFGSRGGGASEPQILNVRFPEARPRFV